MDILRSDLWLPGFSLHDRLYEANRGVRTKRRMEPAEVTAEETAAVALV